VIVEDIVNVIKKDIAAGKIQPGKSLPSVKELQEALAVGRGSVREAFRILEGMGLVRIKKGRGGGAFLAPNAGRIVSESLASLFKIEESHVLAFIEFRKTIEPKMVFNAALHRTQDDLVRLLEAIELVEENVQTKEFFVSATRTFFETIAQATQNDYNVAFYRHIDPVLAETTRLIYEVPRCVDLSMHFYSQIYECIKAGNPMKAEMISEAYLVQMENSVKSAKNFDIPFVQRARTIKWGAILDLTGTLSDYGKQVAMGMMDAVRYLNERGGINGNNIELVVYDDKYKVTEGVNAFRRLKDDENVTGIHVQSTETTQFLAPASTRERMFMFTSAFTAKLTNPKKYPYHFSLGPTYSDMARVGIKYIRDTWSKSHRNPKVVFMYPDNIYGRDPLEAAKLFADELGVDVGPDQIVNWPTIDAVPQLLLAQEYDPDFIFITSSALNGSNILKDAKRLQIKSQFIGNIRVITENLPIFAMEAAEGVIGVQPFAPFGADVRGMEDLFKYHNKWHPQHQATLAYIEGWLNIVVPAEASRMADDAGKLTAEGLKEAMENIRDFDSGGLLPLLSYFENDHRATTSARILRVDRGRLIPITDCVDVGRGDKYFEI